MSQIFASGDQRIGASPSASVLPMMLGRLTLEGLMVLPRVKNLSRAQARTLHGIGNKHQNREISENPPEMVPKSQMWARKGLERGCFHGLFSVQYTQHPRTLQDSAAHRRKRVSFFSSTCDSAAVQLPRDGLSWAAVCGWVQVRITRVHLESRPPEIPGAEVSQHSANSSHPKLNIEAVGTHSMYRGRGGKVTIY